MGTPSQPFGIIARRMTTVDALEKVTGWPPLSSAEHVRLQQIDTDTATGLSDDRTPYAAELGPHRSPASQGPPVAFPVTNTTSDIKDGAAMYTPEQFREDDLPTLQALMRDNSFAALVTQHEGVPFASHLPLMLAADEGPYGTLYGHMARANAQWRDFDASQDVLVIFQGPHTYVSPSWYEADPTNVPTWNYAVVHAYGSPRLITDDDVCQALLEMLVRTHEAPFATPWRFQGPEAELRKKMQGIVTCAIRITRLEGKLKLSQNRSRADQQQVAETLQQSADPGSRDVGTLMQQRQHARRT